MPSQDDETNTGSIKQPNDVAQQSRTVSRGRGGTTWMVVKLFVVSALPLIAVSLWVRSYVFGDWIQYHNPNRPVFVAIASSHGHLTGSWERGHADYKAGWDGSYQSGVERSGIPAVGIWPRFLHEDIPDGRRVYRFDIPYWLIVLLMIIPLFVIWRRRITYLHVSRCVRRNVCPKCGYDLRATPERCPECGHRPVSPSTTPASLTSS